MSRKKQVYEKITALYCRISLDDGGDNESMSISNQKLMLRDFAEKHGMFQYEYYVDDGYTGRNFNRPSFQRMIADIEAGKIGCVITKDLSRLGRKYIEAGRYIEIFFPKHKPQTIYQMNRTAQNQIYSKRPTLPWKSRQQNDHSKRNSCIYKAYLYSRIYGFCTEIADFSKQRISF